MQQKVLHVYTTKLINEKNIWDHTTIKNKWNTIDQKRKKKSLLINYWRASNDDYPL